MSYRMFIDDIRSPSNNDMIVCRSSAEAIDYIKINGLPYFMSLDHDLGGTDTVMDFIKAMTDLYPDGPVPQYQIHSANPEGSKNMDAYLRSWKRSLE